MAEQRARLLAAAPPAVLALVCAALAIHAELGRAVPQAAISSAASLDPRARELLGGLHVGERLAGWNVITLGGPIERGIEIGLEREDVRFVVTVAPMGTRPENPAVQTDRHAIYYGNAVPGDRPIPEGAVRAITAAVARRVAAHEHELSAR